MKQQLTTSPASNVIDIRWTRLGLPIALVLGFFLLIIYPIVAQAQFENAPPVAGDDAYTVAEDSAGNTFTVLENDSDPDFLDNMYIVAVGAPSQGGSVAQDYASVGGVLTSVIRYTPTVGFVGVETFTYTIEDNAGASDTALVTVTVESNNPPPIITTDPVTTAVQDSEYIYNVGVTDNQGDELELTAPVLPAWLTLFGRQLSGAPAETDVGQHPVELLLTDTAGGTDTQAYTITVQPVNDFPPAFTSAPPLAATEGVAYLYKITTGDGDNGDYWRITAPNKPAWLTLQDNGDGTAVLSGVPGNEDVGPNAVALRLVDSGGLSDNQSFTINVSNSNNAPAPADDRFSVPELWVNVPLDVLANDADPDADPLTITAVGQPAGHVSNTVAISNGVTLVYSPTVLWTGTDAFTYTVSDGSLAATATVTVTVDDINYPPFPAPDQFTLWEDTPTVQLDLVENDYDSDVGDTMTIVALGDPAAGEATQIGDFLVNYTPPADFNGEDYFSYTVVDSGGLTNTAAVTLTINAINDPPVFTSEPILEATEDSPYSYAVSTNDVDGGDALTITAPILPGWLTLSDNGDGTAVLSGAPTNADAGLHPVILQVTDDAGGTSQQPFQLLAGNVNDAPVANDDAFAVDEGEQDVRFDVLANDRDEDGDLLTITAATAANGTATTDGRFLSYTPNPGYSGPDTINYTIDDGNGGSDTAAAAVTVHATAADLALSYSSPVDTIHAQEAQGIPGTLTVNNNGPAPAAALVLTVTLNAEATLAATGGACAPHAAAGATTLVCTRDELAAGETWTLDVNAALSAEIGTVHVETAVSARGDDPDPANNNDGHTVSVSGIRERRQAGALTIVADSFTDLGNGLTRAQGDVAVGDHFYLPGGDGALNFDESGVAAAEGTLTLILGDFPLFRGGFTADAAGLGAPLPGYDAVLSHLAGFIAGDVSFTALDLAAGQARGRGTITTQDGATTTDLTFTILPGPAFVGASGPLTLPYGDGSVLDVTADSGYLARLQGVDGLNAAGVARYTLPGNTGAAPEARFRLLPDGAIRPLGASLPGITLTIDFAALSLDPLHLETAGLVAPEATWSYPDTPGAVSYAGPVTIGRDGLSLEGETVTLPPIRNPILTLPEPTAVVRAAATGYLLDEFNGRMNLDLPENHLAVDGFNLGPDIDERMISSTVPISETPAVADAPLSALEAAPTTAPTFDLPPTGLEGKGRATQALDSLSAGLVAHYEFDEPAGATTFVDSSGNGYDITCSGEACPTAGSEGTFETNAVVFDGQHDRLKTPDLSGMPSGNFTIAFWYRYDDEWFSRYGSGRQLQYIIDNTVFNPMFYLRRDPRRVRYKLIPSYVERIRSSDNGRWIHVALVAQENEEDKVYVNGDPEGLANDSIQWHRPRLVIGGSGSDSIYERMDKYFHGGIDDFRIYDRALTADQVNSLLLPSDVPQMMVHLPFEGPDYLANEGTAGGQIELRERCELYTDYADNFCAIFARPGVHGTGVFMNSYGVRLPSTMLPVSGSRSVCTWMHGPHFTFQFAEGDQGRLDINNRIFPEREVSGYGTFASFTPTGEPQFICFTYDDAVGKGRIYVDAQLIDEGRWTPVNQPAPATIDAPFTVLDELRIYNYALTQAEIEQLLAAGEAALVNDDPPIALWRFDESVGAATFDDESSNDNDLDCRYPNCPRAEKPGKLDDAIELSSESDQLVSEYSVDSNATTLCTWLWMPDGAPPNISSVISHQDWELFVQRSSLSMQPGVWVIFGHRQTLAYERGLVLTWMGANEWLHICGVYDGTQKPELFINGEGSQGGGYGDFNGTNSSEQVEITGIPSASIFLDDTRVYDRALSEAEIAELAKNFNGPVAWLSLDESSDYKRLQDSSGNGSTGLSWGDNRPAAQQPGRVGYAMHFDGVDDYIDLGNDPILQYEATSVCAWVNPDPDVADYTRIAERAGGAGGGWSLRVYDGTFIWQHKNASSSTNVRSERYTPGEWYLVCGLYDPESDTQKLYVNNVEQTKTLYDRASLGNDGAVQIGRRAGYNGNYFKGALDEVRVYHYPISVERIKKVSTFNRRVDLQLANEIQLSLINPRLDGATLFADGVRWRLPDSMGGFEDEFRQPIELGPGDADLPFPDAITLSGGGGSLEISDVDATLENQDDDFYILTIAGAIILNIPGQGESEATVSISGRLQADSNQKFSGAVSDFEFSLAGITAAASDIAIEDESLAAAEVALTVDQLFGGASVSLYDATFRQPDDFSVSGGKFELPEIQAGNFTIVSLSGEAKRDPDNPGYLISADGAFPLPGGKATAGCTINAGVTIGVDEFGRQVVTLYPLDEGTELVATPADGGEPAAIRLTPERVAKPIIVGREQAPDLDHLPAPGSAQGVRLREVRLALEECDPGIPLGNTGAYMTRVAGTLTLDTGSVVVRIEAGFAYGQEVEIAGESARPATAETAATISVTNKIPWEFDLEGSVKLFDQIEVGSGWLHTGPGEIVNGGYVQRPYLDAHLEANYLPFPALKNFIADISAWIDEGEPYFAGRATTEIGVRIPGWLVDRARDLCVWPCEDNWVPTSVTLGEIGAEFGRFTNDAWGFKGWVDIDVGFDLPRLCAGGWGPVPEKCVGGNRITVWDENVGFYIDTGGNMSLNIDNYQLASRNRLQHAYAAQMAAAQDRDAAPLVVDNDVHITSSQEALVDFTIPQGANVSVLLDGGENAPSLTLIDPDGNEYGPNTLPDFITTTAAAGYGPAPRLGGVGSDGLGQVRVVHAVDGAPAVDILLDNDAAPLFSSVAFSDATVYEALPPGDYTLTIVAAGTTAPALAQAEVGVAPGEDATVIISGAPGALTTVTLNDDNTLRDSGDFAYLRLVHAAPHAPGVSVGQLAGPTILGDVAPFSQSGYAALTAQGHNLQLSDAGGGELLLQLWDAPLAAGGVYSLILFEAADGSLLATLQEDAAPAGRMRLMHAAAGEGTVDVLVNGRLLAGDAAPLSLSSYRTLPAGEQMVQVFANNTLVLEATTVLTPNQDVTLALFDDGGLSITPIVDEIGGVQPEWSAARFAHLGGGQPALDVVVGGGSEPAVSDLSVGRVTSHTLWLTTTHSLEIYEAGSNNLLATFPDVNPTPGQSYIYFFGDDGGTLALVIGEEATLTPYHFRDYQIADAPGGTWQAKLSGDLFDEEDYRLQIFGADPAPTLNDVTVNASAAAATVNWSYTSAEPASVVDIFAKPGPLAETQIIDGAPVITDVYSGFPVLSDLTNPGDPGWIDGAPQSATFFFDEIPSGDYTIWVQANDFGYPRLKKAAPTMITVDHPWPASWSGGLTAAPAGYREMVLSWQPLDHVDNGGHVLTVRPQAITHTLAYTLSQTADTYTMTNLNPGQTYTVTLSAYNYRRGAASTAETITFTPPPPPFTVQQLTALQPLHAGEGQALTFRVSTTEAPFPAAVTLLPGDFSPGLALDIEPNVVTPTTAGVDVTAIISANQYLSGGVYTATMIARGGGAYQTIPLQPDVIAPDFSLSAAPDALTLGAGEHNGLTVSAAGANGHDAPITLDVLQAPHGVAWSFNKSDILPGETAVLHLTRTLLAENGVYDLVIGGDDGPNDHAVTVTLDLAQPDFIVTPSVTEQRVAPGEAAAFTLDVAFLDGWDEPVTLSLDPSSAANAGAVSFMATPGESLEPPRYQATLEKPGPVYLALQTTAATPEGVYLLPVTATGGDETRQLLLEVVVGRAHLYLPFVSKQTGPAAPDLVVDSIEVVAGQAQIKVRNAGGAPVSESFWVDLYVDPSPPPTAVNQVWPDLSAHGAAWGVEGVTLPPGGTMTLAVNDGYYVAASSDLPASLPAGASLYAQVDSANAGVAHGAILEGHEQRGEPYNNITGPIMTTAAMMIELAGSGAPESDTAVLPPR